MNPRARWSLLAALAVCAAAAGILFFASGRAQARHAAEELLDAMHRADYRRAVELLSWTNMEEVARREGSVNNAAWGPRWERQPAGTYDPDRFALYRVWGKDGQEREVRFEIMPEGRIARVWMHGRERFKNDPTYTPGLPAEAPNP